jgi:hypothetical protein
MISALGFMRMSVEPKFRSYIPLVAKLAFTIQVANKVLDSASMGLTPLSQQSVAVGEAGHGKSGKIRQKC